jgi:hypothetical protein
LIKRCYQYRSLVGGCADTPVVVDETGNTDGKRPCLSTGQTVLMRTPTQTEFVECGIEVIIRNGLPRIFLTLRGSRIWARWSHSSNNLDYNICWRCYRQKHRTTPIQLPCRVHVQGLCCEYCWSIEGWIHSQRRNSLDQKLVEKLVYTHTHKPGVEGEFGWHTTSSITLGHRVCHRWDRWWERRGTGSLIVDSCYSNLLNLLRVKTHVSSYNLYPTPFLSYPSQSTLVKLIKLKRTQTVYTEKERKRERKKEDNFIYLFLKKKLTPVKKM